MAMYEILRTLILIDVYLAQTLFIKLEATVKSLEILRPLDRFLYNFDNRNLLFESDYRNNELGDIFVIWWYGSCMEIILLEKRRALALRNCCVFP